MGDGLRFASMDGANIAGGDLSWYCTEHLQREIGGGWMDADLATDRGCNMYNLIAAGSWAVARTRDGEA